MSGARENSDIWENAIFKRRYELLHQRFVELLAETARVRNENRLLKDELEIERKIVSELRGGLLNDDLMNRQGTIGLDISRINPFGAFGDDDRPTLQRLDSPIRKQSKPEPEELTPGARLDKVGRLSDRMKMLFGASTGDEALERVRAVCGDVQVFAKSLGLVQYEEDSPYLRWSLSAVERRQESAEALMAKWLRHFSGMEAGVISMINILGAFVSDLQVDLLFFENNVEMQAVLVTLQEFLSETMKQHEIYQVSLANAVIAPLKAALEALHGTSREAKKRHAKALEEFVWAESKFANTKKSSVTPTQVKSLQTNYLSAEMARLDYLQALFAEQSNAFTVLAERATTFLLAHFGKADNSAEMVRNLEPLLNILGGSLVVKRSYFQNVLGQFAGIRADLKQLERSTPLTPNSLIKLGQRAGPRTDLSDIRGYLYSRKNKGKEWTRRYYFTDRGSLYVVKDPKLRSGDVVLEPTLLTDIRLCLVKETPESDYASSFELTSVSLQKPLMLRATSDAEKAEWLTTLKAIQSKMLASNQQGHQLGQPQPPPADHRESPESRSRKDSDPISSGPALEKLTGMRHQDLIQRIIYGNSCADCGATQPQWLSLNLGVILCIDCAGYHRRLGPTVSKVRSLVLDNLPIETLQMLAVLENKIVNQEVWETNLPQCKTEKPNGLTPGPEREKFVRLKYEMHQFINDRFHGDQLLKSYLKVLEDSDLVHLLGIIHFFKLDLNSSVMHENRRTTWFHLAARYGNVHAVALLLENGASLIADEEDHVKPIDLSLIHI
eukprot:TRINITY_DN6659_c0_g1_i7.p1 TRINITY_DN6659_c0_g1~~TRINITY_DN6659_c0_g1_i7.p1  ORF type:complete len:782 (+),score=175.88 TRINITY_DN6659_c0_g1_i7:50-2395(+)